MGQREMDLLGLRVDLVKSKRREENHHGQVVRQVRGSNPVRVQ